MYKDIATYSKNDTKKEPKVLENEANGIKFTAHKYGGKKMIDFTEKAKLNITVESNLY